MHSSRGVHIYLGFTWVQPQRNCCKCAKQFNRHKTKKWVHLVSVFYRKPMKPFSKTTRFTGHYAENSGGVSPTNALCLFSVGEWCWSLEMPHFLKEFLFHSQSMWFLITNHLLRWLEWVSAPRNQMAGMQGGLWNRMSPSCSDQELAIRVRLSATALLRKSMRDGREPGLGNNQLVRIISFCLMKKRGSGLKATLAWQSNWNLRSSKWNFTNYTMPSASHAHAGILLFLGYGMFCSIMHLGLMICHPFKNVRSWS